MEVKPKKCKGTGKAKGYGCGEPTLWRKYGLCIGCYPNWLLNTPEGEDVIKKNTIRASKQTTEEKKKADREFKLQNKSIAKLMQEARVPFQAWIKRRDANLKCISCGNNSETWNGGHYKKAELYSGVIFDEINVNKQCVYCNLHLDGNEANYRLGLVKKYGSVAVSNIEELAEKTRIHKWDRNELIEIKNKYKLKLKEK